MNAAMRRYKDVRRRIDEAAASSGRQGENIRLVAASKRQDPDAIRALAACGQRAFGENYLQEALEKQSALADLDLEWHFIGRIQSNKTRAIAGAFNWVHSIDRVKIAERLAQHRPAGLGPLNVCVEVNISGEAAKAGAPPHAVPEIVAAIRALPALALRGLMTLPAPTPDVQAQRAAFRELTALAAELGRPVLDTLSMGTTQDFAAAIAEGATLVRIGTALFGPRPD